MRQASKANYSLLEAGKQLASNWLAMGKRLFKAAAKGVPYWDHLIAIPACFPFPSFPYALERESRFEHPSSRYAVDQKGTVYRKVNIKKTQ